MYYHYQELGRSANTAHLYEAVCPSAKFEKVVFGDTEAEVKLVQDILTETMNEEPVTCVLYPSKDAILLSDWIKQRPASCKDKPIRYCTYPPFLPLDFLSFFFPPSLLSSLLSFFLSVLIFTTPCLCLCTSLLISVPSSTSYTIFLSLT